MLAQAKFEAKESKEAKSDIHLFNLIYQAAKEKNSAVITALLKAVCIDVQNGYHTPVSQLAAEGHFEAVTFLRKNFNASLLWMAYGYALGGHVAAANDVLKLAAPAERLALLQIIVAELKKKNTFATVESSLQTLVIFNPENQKIIANELKDLVIVNSNDQKIITHESKNEAKEVKKHKGAKEEKGAKETKVTVKDLLPKAAKLHQVMTSKRVNYKQASGWIDPKLSIWLLQGCQLVKNGKFPLPVFLNIASFFSGTSPQETCDLSNKLAMHTCSDRFFNNLRQSCHLVMADNTMAPLQLKKEEKGNAPAAKEEKRSDASVPKRMG